MKKLKFLLLLLTLSSLSIAQSLSDDLKAHYTFDRHLMDETDEQNDLEIIDGEPDYMSITSNDAAALFNGNTRFKTIDEFDNSDYTTISISLWFRSTTITPNLQIMLQGAFMGFGIYIAPNTGKVVGFFDGSSADAVESEEVLTDGEWHHILITSDGHLTSMYVDGAFNNSRQELMVVGNGSWNNRLYFGLSNLYIQPFTGALNEVRIYNRLLDDSEIDLLSQSFKPELTSTEDPVIGTTKMAAVCEFELSPNPASNFVKISPEKVHSYQIYSAGGQLVLQGIGTEINVSELPFGLYIVNINGCSKKLVVQEL